MAVWNDAEPWTDSLPWNDAAGSDTAVVGIETQRWVAEPGQWRNLLTQEIHSLTGPPVTTQIYGMGGGLTGAAYTNEVNTMHAKAIGVYGQGMAYSTFGGSVPDTHPMFMQIKANKGAGLATRADFDAILATFPATRPSPVYLYYWNEPENDMSATTWKSVTSLLYASIDASGKSYIVKSCELMEYTLNPGSGRDPNAWMHPDCEHVGWSVFASAKVSNGHWVAGTNPTTQATRLADFMTTVGKPWSCATFGMPVREDYLSDQVSLDNRLTWTKNMFNGMLAQSNLPHLILYYDLNFFQTSTGLHLDYRLTSDPRLLSFWNANTPA